MTGAADQAKMYTKTAVDGVVLEAVTLAELAACAGAELNEPLAMIEARARRVAASAHVDASSAEIELGRIATDLRRAVLRTAHDHADVHLRSPQHGIPKLLPSGAEVDYGYERGASATVLEARIAQHAPSLEGWSSQHVLFSSAMGGMAAVLQCLRSLLQPSTDKPLHIGSWSSYFETDMLLEFMSGQTLSWETVDDLQMATASGKFDALLVEPIRYDWNLTAADLHVFVSAWRASVRRPRMLIIDSTLASFTWPAKQVLSALPDGFPLLVVDLRSGLKLDQQGLELANVGVVSVYSCYENMGTPTASQFADYLRTARTLTGTALSMDAMSALDTPFVFDPTWTARHAGQVFLNNASLASAIFGQRGLFSKVSHPSLDGHGPLKHAPFVVCQLAEDTIENHGLLLAVIRHEVKQRRIDFIWGSSFGFRGHRYETIVPRLSSQRGLFKVAMGSQCGPSLVAVLDLLGDLSGYQGFDALGRHYPDVEPIDLMSMAVPSNSSSVDCPPLDGCEPPTCEGG